MLGIPGPFLILMCLSVGSAGPGSIGLAQFLLSEPAGGITGMLTQLGLPAWLAYGVYVGEIVAPLMVIAGWFARSGAALIAVNMVFALLLAHRSQLTDIGGSGGWALELQGMESLGSGRYGINHR